MKTFAVMTFGVALVLVSDLVLASAASSRASDLPRRDGRNHPLDSLLVGVNEQIEENRRRRAQQQELARLAEEEQRLQAEIAAEQARLLEQQAKEQADAQRRQERQQQLENRRRLIGAGVGAGVGVGAGMDAQGTIEMMQTFSEGVANDDPNQVYRGGQRVANDYIQRRQQELAELRARRAGVAGGTPTPAPAAAPTQMAANSAATTSGKLESKFFGTYRSDSCPSNCYWQLNADGSGVWSAGFLDGSSATIPITWWPLIDSTGGVQKAVSSSEVGYILGVRYNQSVPERVKKGMTFAGQASNESTLRVYQSADGSQCCFLNFRGQLNAFYRK